LLSAVSPLSSSGVDEWPFAHTAGHVLEYCYKPDRHLDRPLTPVDVDFGRDQAIANRKISVRPPLRQEEPSAPAATGNDEILYQAQRCGVPFGPTTVISIPPLR